MDSTTQFYLALLSVLLCGLIGITLYFSVFRRRTEEPDENDNVVVPAVRREVVQRPNAPGRRALRRRPDIRPQADADASEHDSGDDSEEDENENNKKASTSKKVGVKKQRKLDEKELKKQQREADKIRKEEAEKRQTELEEKRRQQEVEDEAEAERVRAKLEKERLEKEQKEHEEYMALKTQFEVEEEGVDAMNEDEERNMFAEFISYLEEHKICMLEQIATHFKLRIQDVIDRLQKLMNDGTINGVIDDRGKFIFITRDELESIADFINERGRISIKELAVNTNKFIKVKQASAS